MIGSWITHNDESWFLELLGVLVGKGTWSPLSSEVVGTSVGGELKDSSLGKSSVGDNEDILWVVNGSDDSSRDHELFPGLGKIEEIDTLVSGVNIWLHFSGAVEGTEMGVGSKHESEILSSGVGVGKRC